MTSLFISYSRKDIEIARKLTDAFKGQDLDFWIDWEGIPPTVDWWKEIERGIEQADIFLFLISPESSKSKVCHQEIDHAARNGKRLIPIVVQDIKGEDAPVKLKPLNWIFIRENDDFDQGFEKLIAAVKTDFDWVQIHSQLQVKALEWERSGYENSFLLRGKELQDAEIQLATNSSKEPYPTDLQREYVLKSRQSTDRQRRTTFGIAVAGIIALAALALFGFIQAGLATDEANQRATAQANAESESNQRATAQADAEASAEEALLQAKIARAGELAALALTEQNKHFDLALLFGLESFYTHETLRSKGTLLSLTNSHPGWDMLLSGHNGPINSVAFSPDGRTLASGGSDGIILWDFSDSSAPSQLSTLEGNILGVVLSVAFSPDGRTLASGYVDFNVISNVDIPVNTIILWDISNPTSPSQLATIEGNGSSVNSVAFSPNGETLASGGNDGIITLWDITDPAIPSQLAAFEGNQYSGVYDVAFSPNGETLASGYWDIGIVNVYTVILWDISNPTTPTQLAALEGHNGSVGSVTFSPDGETLASGSTDNTIILWNIGNPISPSQLATLVGHNGSVSSVAFSPNGEMLASGSTDNTIILWNISDLSTPSQLARFEGHSSGVNSVAFNPDGETLASGSEDNTLILWDFNDLTTPAQLETLKGRGSNVYSTVFSPDGRFIVSGSNDNSATLWDISNSTNPIQLARLEGNIFREGFLFSSVFSVAISPDGNTLVSGYSDLSNLSNDDKPLNVIILWDISDPRSPSELVMLEGHDESVSSVAFSPDGKTLASGGWDDRIILWDISDRASPSQLATLDGHRTNINSVVFSPNREILASGASDGSIILWDISDPTAPSQLATLEEHGILSRVSVAFSPDGKTLASGSSDNTIILWDINDPATPSQLATLQGHNENVNSVAFSPDGQILASGSDDDTISFDNTIILWNISDLTAPSQLVTLEGSGGLVNINSVIFSPSGKTLATGTDDGTVILWDLDPLSWVKKVCRRVGRNFTRAEWAQYFPGEEYRKTCEQWPAGN